MATNSEIVETPDTEEASQLDNLERLSVILSRIESSKQQTALGLGLLSNTFTGVFAYLAGAGANR